MGRNGLSVVENNDVQEGGIYRSMAAHPAGKGGEAFRALEDLKASIAKARKEEMRAHLLRIQSAARADIQDQLEALLSAQETQRTLLEYRIAGGTLEGLGDLSDDEAISHEWAFLGGEFDL